MIIYKITNLINNKIYIGRTINTIGERFKRHMYDCKSRNSLFCRALKKYGKDNYKIDLEY